MCPDGVPATPTSVEVMRNMFSFLVRQRQLNDALALAPTAVKLFLTADLEGSAFKILASVTVIQLAQGDSVKVSLRGCENCAYVYVSM